MAESLPALSVLTLYFAVILAVGWAARRRADSGREGFFLANRSFGMALLFLAVLGTNLSAFAMLGAAGATYHAGVGVYWTVAAALSVTFPLLFMFLGVRIWRSGKRFGHLTPIQMLSHRFASPAVGLAAFCVMLVYTVPYVVIGQMGSGLALEGITGGRVPYWAGSLLVTLVVGFYVTRGGMRGTAVTNAVQVITFLVFLAIAFVAVPAAVGGFDTLGRQLVGEHAHLLRRGATPQTTPLAAILQVFTFTAAFVAFPQVSLRMLAARSGAVIRRMSVFYPLGFFLTFVPVTALALWGAVTIPGLEGAQADNILIMLVGRLMPAWIAGLGVAALFAMIMSTMDAQVLALANLFTVDVADRLRPAGAGDEGRAVRLGRWFVVGVLAVCFAFSLVRTQSVLAVANLAFTGFGVLFPVLVGAFYSRRMNAAGALAGIVVGSALVPLAYLGVLDLGPLPSLPIVAIETVVIVLVTAVTPANRAAADRYVERSRAGARPPALAPGGELAEA